MPLPLDRIDLDLRDPRKYRAARGEKGYQAPPLVLADQWLRLMDAAHWLCCCQGECGRAHHWESCRDRDGRLTISPEDLTTPAGQVPRLPESALTVRCHRCLTAATRRAKEARRERAAGEPLTLF